LVAVLLVPALAWATARQIRRRHMHLWLGAYLRQTVSRRLAGPRRPRPESIDVLLCIADHFEPGWAGATGIAADERVAAWVRDYPRLMGGFRDSDGRPPRHTFFYPIDQYEPAHVNALAGLCRQGFGEVEIHLHHDHDTAENLERTLRRFTRLFAQTHGVLGRWRDRGHGAALGPIAYGFVHGNWALDNARPDGRWCGVRNELDVLRRTGCYADFTMPSAPDTAQTRKINSIYYAVGDPHRCKSHDHGADVGTVPPPPGALMLIQGPLRLCRHRWRLKPVIENGCIQHSQPPTPERLDQWLRAAVHIPSRPDWLFVKLHTHGATEANRRVLLGQPMVRFHQELARRARATSKFRFHYVTAREMYNLAKAAEAGWAGPVLQMLDCAVQPPGPRTAPPPFAPEYASHPSATAPVGR
jgi:hypothetical protein